jgi:hypothetical protein
MPQLISILLLSAPLISAGAIPITNYESTNPFMTLSTQNRGNLTYNNTPSECHPTYASPTTTLPGTYADNTSVPIPALNPALAATILTYGHPFKQFIYMLLEGQKISEQDLYKYLFFLKDAPSPSSTLTSESKVTSTDAPTETGGYMSTEVEASATESSADPLTIASIEDKESSSGI